MYSIIFLSACTIILIFLLFKQIKLSTNVIVTILLSIIIFYFIVKPQDCIAYSLDGAKLFITAIFPTIFPFMVICNMLIAYGGIEIYSKILGPIICTPLGLSKSSTFAIIASVFCGYPMGAKYSSELYDKGYISRDEFLRLINIASNSGPIFTIGALGAVMLKNKLLGIVIMISCYVSAFFIGIITRKKSSDINTTISSNNKRNKHETFGNILKKSVTDGINSILLIGGYVIIFSIIMSIIKNNAITSIILSKFKNSQNIQNIYAVFLGLLDLTNGCNIVSASSISINLKVCILSFFCAFGSLSVVAQVNAFLYKYDINLKKYISLKILQGIIASMISSLICIFIPLNVATFNSSHYYSTFLSAEIILYLFLASIVIIYNLFHIS